MLGVELVKAGKEPDSTLTEAVLEDMKESGIFIGKSGQGRNVLQFIPPLTISQAEIDRTILELNRILKEYNT